MFRDTGIGMTKEELVDCLGTIAQSGTSKFLKALKVSSLVPLLIDRVTRYSADASILFVQEPI